jgi:hypothetical protein
MLRPRLQAAETRVQTRQLQVQLTLTLTLTLQHLRRVRAVQRTCPRKRGPGALGLPAHSQTTLAQSAPD